MPANAHRLFFNAERDDPSFLEELKVPSVVADNLRSARDEIRNAIVQAIAKWRSRITAADMFVDGLDRNIPRPRFRMQGSFAYHTEVLPYHRPPQQIDMDDGMFLPIRHVLAGGRQQPDVASRALFSLVDGVVAELSKRKGWKHIDSKSSCVRVEISKGEHVDLALYAVPDDEFVRADEIRRRRSSHLLNESIVFDEDSYRQIDGSAILLANRECGWVPSNPKLLEDWFMSKVARHGPHLRRVSRYLKAWRDFNLNCTGLTSIALMAIAVEVFDKHSTVLADNRDDRSLLEVVEVLPERLAREIPNPVVPGQRLDQNWSEQQRAAYCAAAANLRADLIDALLDQETPEDCIAVLTAAMSDRIPSDPTLVEMEGATLEVKSISLPAIGGLSAAAVASRAAAAEATITPARQTRPYYKR